MNPTREMLEGYEALKKHHREHHAELESRDAEIERWKIADSKAVAAARAEAAKLWEVLEGAWYQFAYTGTKGERWCGGLSALEDIADALGLGV